MPDHPLAALTMGRRTAVLGAAATVLVSACDTGDDLGDTDPTGSPSASRSPSPTTAPETEKTPDEVLVDDVLARLGAAVGVLQAARRFKQLRPVIAPLLRAHRAHADVLEGDLASDAPAPRPDDASAATDAVRASETELQAALVDAAGRAESGALAKLIASLSASTTQHLATLPASQSGAPA